MNHPTSQDLVAFGLGKLPDETMTAIADHVDSCSECCQALEEMAPDPFLAQAARNGPGESDADIELDESHRRGKYRLIRLHARGGIGQVWLAHDEALGREVAVKELRPERAGQPAAVARFLAEAKVSGQLEHPGIVPLYQLDADKEGHPCYAMRFVRGRTLTHAAKEYHRKRELGQAEPLELRELLNAFVAVCNTAAYAHSRGVLHRDLKGANVLMGGYGEVLLLDWGLAKVQGEAEPLGSLLPITGRDPDSHHETMEGQVVGTPNYLSPEQAEGRLDLVDARSDVYGLGAILYEILTGRPPFEGRDTTGVLKRVVEEQVIAPRKLVPGTPRGLEAICLKALAKNREDRYASAQAIAAEVRHWLADEPVSAYREPFWGRVGRWGRRHKPVMAGVAVLLLTAVAALAISMVVVKEQQRQTLFEKQRADEQSRLARKAVEDYLVRVTGNPRLNVADLHGLRKELLQSALPFYEAFVQQETSDSSLRVDQGAAWWQLSLVQRTLGDHHKALESARKAEEIFTALLRDNPSEPEYRLRLSRCLLADIETLGDLGRILEAGPLCGRCVAMLDQLSREFPESVAYRFDLARAHVISGMCEANRGRPDEAVKEERQAAQIVEPLVRAFPDKPEYRLLLMKANLNSGACLLRMVRPADAEHDLKLAVTSGEELVKVFPADPEYRIALAVAHLNLAEPLFNGGKNAEAESEARSALELLEELTRDFPSVPDYRSRLAYAYTSLGAYQVEQKKWEQALESFQRAGVLLDRLTADHGDVPEYRSARADAWANRCIVLARQGDHRRAADEANRIDDKSALTYLPRYNLACAWARIREATLQDSKLAQTQRDRQADEAALKAVDWLNKARLAADFARAKVINMLKTDHDLDSLRNRPDFQKLLADLQAPSPSGTKPP